MIPVLLLLFTISNFNIYMKVFEPLFNGYFYSPGNIIYDITYHTTAFCRRQHCLVDVSIVSSRQLLCWQTAILWSPHCLSTAWTWSRSTTARHWSCLVACACSGSRVSLLLRLLETNEFEASLAIRKVESSRMLPPCWGLEATGEVCCCCCWLSSCFVVVGGCGSRVQISSDPPTHTSPETEMNPFATLLNRPQ